LHFISVSSIHGNKDTGNQPSGEITTLTFQDNNQQGHCTILTYTDCGFIHDVPSKEHHPWFFEKVLNFTIIEINNPLNFKCYNMVNFVAFPTRLKFMHKKEYPPFFEKAIPIALVIIGILGIVLLVIAFFVLLNG
jgi:hypothetical protein